MRRVVVAMAVSVVAASAQASGSRGYVVSLFVPAMNSTDQDCPEGKNPNAPGILEQILKEQGKSRAEIQTILDPEKFGYDVFAEHATFRGRIDGKPVNIYTHPMSVPDPNIKLASMSQAFGFDLDGKVDANDFTDPLTGEKGVDHEAARVFGCFDRTRGTLAEPPTNWSVRWGYYNLGNTWLIDVKGADNLKNDDDVEVSIYRGMQAAVKNGQGFQSHMTYDVDPDPRMQNNHFKGSIRNGMFVSDAPIDFFMISSPRLQPEFRFARARLRLSFNPDGSLEGFVGGFLPITMVYFPHGDYAAAGEFNGGMTFPGIYYAMRRLADTDIDKDPKTGARTRISQTYLIRAVPAFLKGPARTTAASAGVR